MQHILVIGIVGREIEAAAEPPLGGAAARRGDQEAYIAVGRRRVRISRMKHQGQTHGLEGCAGNFGALDGRGRRHFVAEHMRERHARPLEYRTVAQDAALAAAASRSIPSIAPESCAVDRFHGRGDSVMQIVQVALDRGCIHGRLRLLFCGTLLCLGLRFGGRGGARRRRLVG